MDRVATVLLVVLVCQLGPVVSYTAEDSDVLTSSLFANYSIKSRPTGVVSINVDFQMTNIQTVDVVNGLFSVAGWWIITWSDSRLEWTPTDHGDISVLVVYEDDVWTPALVVSNSNVDLSAIDDDTIPLRVDSTGAVIWKPPAILQVGCDLDITNYPFDSQTCNVELTSFGYSMLEVDLTSTGGVLMDYYSISGEWGVDGTGVARVEYEDANLDYARLMYEVTITRKSTYYGMNVIFPVVVTGVMTIFVFQVPPESGEKLSYALTILLTFVVLMSLVATNMPTTARYVSLLEVYIGIILALSAIAVVATIFILDLYHTDDKKKIPGWLRRFTLTLHRLFRPCGLKNRVDSNPRPLDREQDSASENMDFESAKKWEASVPGDDPAMSEHVYQDHKAAHRPRSSRSQHDPEVTWPMVANVVDSLMMRVYFCLILVLGVGFLAAMTLHE